MEIRVGDYVVTRDLFHPSDTIWGVVTSVLGEEPIIMVAQRTAKSSVPCSKRHANKMSPPPEDIEFYREMRRQLGVPPDSAW
jgi:hypothetical protein